MKASHIAATAVLALLAAAAQAETYDGVLTVQSTRSRADVAAEAVAAAHSPDPYADGAPAPAFVSHLDRGTVHQQAVAKAHAPNQNLDPKAFEDSVIPPQFALHRRPVQQASR